MKAEADQLMELVPLQLKFLGFSHKTSTYEEIKALAYKLNCCDIRVSNGQTLLHLAVANSDVATVSKLLDAISSQKSSHVFVDYPDWNGRTPIGIAVQNNHEEIVDILLAFGADIDGAQQCVSLPLPSRHGPLTDYVHAALAFLCGSLQNPLAI
jgi:ankyrin repeat protein